VERIAKLDWKVDKFFKEISEEIIRKTAEKKVFLLVSGGVDSTVLFALLNKVLGQEKVLGLHIDNGLMRLGESADIIEYMKKNGFDNLQIYDAEKDFLSALEGEFAPEKKREIIGNMFIEIKTKAQEKLGLNENEWLIAQGTIYPDVVETAGAKNTSKIKTHHNRVDIILELIEKGLVIEPLSALYKDEVRKLGEYLGIPRELIWRHPFPGPGLAVRCLCSTKNEENSKAEEENSLRQIAQNFGFDAVKLAVRSVGVRGGERTYAYPALVFGAYDYENLQKVSTAITNEIKFINRVVFSLFCECDDKKYSLIEGYCTKNRLDKLRKVDKIVNEAIVLSGEYEKIWQMPVVLLPLVNSKGNESIVLRPIISDDAMTAKFYDLSKTAKDTIIKNLRETEGIGDVFLDISHKPPGTIEWE
jgi:GMP synthase (glutamine-hydrolysing)